MWNSSHQYYCLTLQHLTEDQAAACLKLSNASVCLWLCHARTARHVDTWEQRSKVRDGLDNEYLWGYVFFALNLDPLIRAWGFPLRNQYWQWSFMSDFWVLPGKCKGFFILMLSSQLLLVVTTISHGYSYWLWALTDKTDYEERSASNPLDDSYTDKCEYEVEESSNSRIPYSRTIIAYTGHLYNRCAVIPENYTTISQGISQHF